MTCNLAQRCVLCDPGRGFFERRPPSPHYVARNLTDELLPPGRKSNTPHLEFCEGCLKRIGVKFLPEAQRSQTRKAMPPNGEPA